MTLQKDEAYILGSTILAMRQGFTGVRRPSYTEPPFYAKPLNVSRTRRLAPNLPNFVDYLTLRGDEPTFVNVIQSFSIGANVDIEGSGIEFRLLKNGRPYQFVSDIATDITRDTDITPWPLFKRSFEEIIQFRELFTVQVRNLSFNPYFIFAGIWGYKYPDVDAGTYTTREGLRRG